MQQDMLLESIEGLKTKTNKDYIRLTFIKDDLNKITANIWDKTVNTFEHEPLCVYSVSYEKDDYKGNIQMKNVSLSLLENQDKSRFVKKAPIEIDDMKMYIYKIYSSITYSPYKKLIEKILNKNYNGNDFWTQTASKSIHENYTNGLCYHTYKMLKLAEGIVESGVYKCNKDILYTSIIIHDIGKLVEYSSPIGTEVTKAGELIGHISIAYSWIIEFLLEEGIEKDDEHFMLLSHCVLSHHGQLEYGSPVVPKTREAILLNQIDLIDSRMGQIVSAEEKIEEGEFSGNVFGLGRRIYKHNC